MIKVDHKCTVSLQQGRQSQDAHNQLIQWTVLSSALFSNAMSDIDMSQDMFLDSAGHTQPISRWIHAMPIGFQYFHILFHRIVHNQRVCCVLLIPGDLEYQLSTRESARASATRVTITKRFRQ